ncbi:amidohydrolase [Oscillospiraceae bacterium OttesenSCG-928-G22]|nr:amidohydrolase [Oscillospiraceae bacterium OttesenSCG-928-G22]
MDQNNLKLATELRHELHMHPELSMQEEWTRNHLMDFLRKHTKLEVCDRGRWFYAIYHAGDDKPNIAFRADFDALNFDEQTDIPWRSKIPNVAHKCGHDGHAAALAGLALEVDRNGADKNVFFVFQHAEETGQGAFECLPLFDEHRIDEFFAAHNDPGDPKHSIVLRDGTMACASKGMDIYLTGAPAHASMPEDGRNPAFAIAEIVSSIPKLIAPENYKGMVLCTVIQIDLGEQAYGMSASKGVLRLTLRGLFENEMDDLQKKLEDLSRAQAKEYGLECEFSYCDSFPETANHKESADKVRAVAKKLGLTVLEMPEATRGSEDFGHFTKATKGAYFNVGGGEDWPPVHTLDYDFPDDIIETFVEMFKGLIAY